MIGRLNVSESAPFVFLAVSFAVFGNFTVRNILKLTGNEIYITPLSSLMVLYGIYLKATRTALLSPNSMTKKSGNIQFRALSLSYLTNFLLPFRLGELLRLHALKMYGVPFGVSAVAVVIERIFDFIVLECLFLIGNQSLNLGFFGNSLKINALALGISAIFIVFLALENKMLFRVILKMTRIFNVNLEYGIQLSVFSAAQTLRQCFSSPKILGSYIMRLILSWVFILGGVYLFIEKTFPTFKMENKIQYSLLSVFNSTSSLKSSIDQILMLGHLRTGIGYLNSSQISSLWIIFYGGIGLASGLVLVLDLLKRVSGIDKKGLITENPGPGWNGFSSNSELLKNLFAKDLLITESFKMSLRDGTNLVSYLNGGSRALTLLLEDKGIYKVRKIIDRKDEAKLKMQSDWLTRYGDSEIFPRVLRNGHSRYCYYYDMEYLSSTSSLFEVVHNQRIETSKENIASIFISMREIVYKNVSIGIQSGTTEKYFEEYLTGRVAEAQSRNESLNLVATWDGPLLVNGRTIRNYPLVVEELSNLKERLKALDATCTQTSSCHGDLTVGNILISRTVNSLQPSNLYLIDPSDDNPIRGPIIDIARLLQSLQGGYEFLISDPRPIQPTIRDNVLHVDFDARVSSQYAELSNFVKTEIAPKYLQKEEIRGLSLHVGILYGRMLGHRNQIDPDNAVKYFAMSLLFLNDFIEEFYRE
jgi:Lysylphosphatidylglycerol synthase TM region